MNIRERIELFFKRLRQQEQYIESISSIYKILSVYELPQEERSIDLQNVKESVTDKVNKHLEKIYREHVDANTLPPINSFRIEDQGLFFKHINVTFKDNPYPGPRELVKVYLPIHNNFLEEAALRVYNFLNNSRISYFSKIAGYGRLDNFIVRVFNVEDAKKLIDFCNNDEIVKKHIRSSNPFIPEERGIGVAKDTYNESYNHAAASELYMFFEKCKKEGALDNLNFTSFYKYLLNRGEEISNIGENGYHEFCVNEIIENMKAVVNGVSPLQHMEEMEKKSKIKFDANYFYSFKRYKRDGNYFYTSPDGKEIYYGQSDWYKLQAMKFCHALYKYRYGESPKQSFYLNNNILAEIKHNFDLVNDAGTRYIECPVIPSELFKQEPDIRKLYAATCAYIAMIRGSSEKTIEEIYKKVVSYTPYFKTDSSRSGNVDSIDPIDNKNKRETKLYQYQVGDKSVKSSIPLIKINNSHVGIEFLDEETLVNIVLIKGNRLIRYKGVHLSVDKDLLVETKENSEYARAYRASVGNILSDTDRNERMLKTREGHFGILRYSINNNGVSKFYDPDIIQNLYARKIQGTYAPQVVEEKVSKFRR